jgi:RNA polymerase sigma-70 factor (ECF subfamily)
MTSTEATRLFYTHVWPHRAMVLRTARFLTRRAADADDLAQETLVKAFKSIARFDTSNPSGVKGWLSAILRNTWIDHLRAKRLDAVSLEAAELAPPTAPEAAGPADAGNPAALLEQFSDQDLIHALQTLPEEIRWTLLLVDVEQLDHTEAARILDIPEGTVKSRAHRGRRMLKEFIVAHSSVEESP